jgi:hypothetical protein
MRDYSCNKDYLLHGINGSGLQWQLCSLHKCEYWQIIWIVSGSREYWQVMLILTCHVDIDRSRECWQITWIFTWHVNIYRWSEHWQSTESGQFCLLKSNVRLNFHFTSPRYGDKWQGRSRCQHQLRNTHDHVSWTPEPYRLTEIAVASVV